MILFLHSFRTLNTFFYAFSLSGFAIERYLLVCRATMNTFLRNFKLKMVFYFSLSLGPFVIWSPFVAVLFWDEFNLFMGHQYEIYVTKIKPIFCLVIKSRKKLAVLRRILRQDHSNEMRTSFAQARFK